MVVCYLCSSTSRNHDGSFFRVPVKPAKRLLWAEKFHFPEDFDYGDDKRVCSLHFKNGINKDEDIIPCYPGEEPKQPRRFPVKKPKTPKAPPKRSSKSAEAGEDDASSADDEGGDEDDENDREDGRGGMISDKTLDAMAGIAIKEEKLGRGGEEEPNLQGSLLCRQRQQRKGEEEEEEEDPSEEILAGFADRNNQYHCAVKHCSSNRLKTDRFMYPFPKNAYWLQQWKKQLRLPASFEVVPGVRVCSLHFASEPVKPKTLPLPPPVRTVVFKEFMQKRVEEYKPAAPAGHLPASAAAVAACKFPVKYPLPAGNVDQHLETAVGRSRCVVYGCSTRINMKENMHRKVFSLQTTGNILDSKVFRWLARLGMAADTDTFNANVCEKHFQDHCPTEAHPDPLDIVVSTTESDDEFSIVDGLQYVMEENPNLRGQNSVSHNQMARSTGWRTYIYGEDQKPPAVL